MTQRTSNFFTRNWHRCFKNKKYIDYYNQSRTITHKISNLIIKDNTSNIDNFSHERLRKHLLNPKIEHKIFYILFSKMSELKLESRVTMTGLFISKILTFPLTLVTLHGFGGVTHNYIRIWNPINLEWKIFKFDEDLVDILQLEQGICACIFENGKIILWDVYLEEPILTLEGHTHRVTSIIAIPGGYITTSEDGTLKMWKRNECFRSMEARNTFNCVLLLQDSFIVGTSGGDLHVFDMKGNLQIQLPDHRSAIINLKLLPENQLLSQCYRGEIRIWNIQTWKYTTLFKSFDSNIKECSNFPECIKDLPPKLIQEIENDRILHNVGKFLVALHKNNPGCIIIDTETQKITYKTIPHHCSNVMGNKLITGDPDSLCIYTL